MTFNKFLHGRNKSNILTSKGGKTNTDIHVFKKYYSKQQMQHVSNVYQNN